MNLPGVELGDGVLMPFVDESLSLGVLLDCSLTWKPHIYPVTNKVNKAMFGKWFVKFCTTETVRRQFVEALVLSHLN